MKQELLGGISPEQYRWLKIRLGTSSDAEASRITEVTKERLRRWKDNDAFMVILLAARDDKIKAFRLLSLSMAQTALEALEFLLTSPKGTDKKAGLILWTRIFQIGEPDKAEQELLPQQIFNILNLRGEIPPEVLDMVGGNRQKRLPAPRVIAVEDGNDGLGTTNSMENTGF